MRCLADPQDGIERGQFGPGIHPQHFAGIRRLQRQHGLSGAPQDARQVGQIKLVVRIVGAQPIDIAVQCIDLEGVDAGVDFTNLRLRRRERLLLDDGLDFIAIARRRAADNAAVTEWVGRRRGENGHGGPARPLKVAESSDGLGANQRHVAGEHQHLIVGGQRLAALQDGVPGSKLLRLLDETHAIAGNSLAHLLRLVPDDAVNITRGNHGGSGADYVGNQRQAADLVQHLGRFGFQARTLARGQDGDGKTRSCGNCVRAGHRSRLHCIRVRRVAEFATRQWRRNPPMA